MKRWRKRELITFREKAKIIVPALALTIIGFVVAYQFVAPAPPRGFSLATGSPEGVYYKHGLAYRDILKRDGVELTVRTTAGSVENLKLLTSKEGGVDAALIQGGVGSSVPSGEIESLGSLFYEPMWIFHRTDARFKRLTDLKGAVIAVGPEGSGAGLLALELLALNGVAQKNTRIIAAGSRKAADMLLAGEVDAAIFINSHRASFMTPLFGSRSVSLMDMDRTEAYALRYHYLYVLKLPEGVIDLAANIPPGDVSLLAPTTQLAVRTDLHPALMGLLLQAAEEIHSGGGGFERQGQFPTPRHLDFALSAEANRFYKSGPPFLQTWLPFWVAIFIARMKIMLLPMIALLYPLFKLMPPIYRWRMRSRIYRWYSKLEAVDANLHGEEAAARPDDSMAALNNLEEAVSQISVPLAFTEELYHLRVHIELLRNKIQNEPSDDGNGEGSRKERDTD
ncbi:MAG: ABC transporter substrate-binding protein [Desulfobacterales bacterium]|nr:ABC transporter substrate-binding protein [Desulfobacterales bacterium]